MIILLISPINFGHKLLIRIKTWLNRFNQKISIINELPNKHNEFFPCHLDIILILENFQVSVILLKWTNLILQLVSQLLNFNIKLIELKFLYLSSLLVRLFSEFQNRRLRSQECRWRLTLILINWLFLFHKFFQSCPVLYPSFFFIVNDLFQA